MPKRPYQLGNFSMTSSSSCNLFGSMVNGIVINDIIIICQRDFSFDSVEFNCCHQIIGFKNIAQKHRIASHDEILRVKMLVSRRKCYCRSIYGPLPNYFRDKWMDKNGLVGDCVSFNLLFAKLANWLANWPERPLLTIFVGKL